nr:hypothetical protein BaRGS_027585 [Batillaria attramentaria]
MLSESRVESRFESGNLRQARRILFWCLQEFPNSDDTYYLAHCYPYTFTDLKDDLDVLMASPERKACELRDRFIFKMVPMLNPDGVIVGNYRCSLAARDLNRNYRHPRRENFPTIYNVKAMVEELAQKHEIMLYGDLHGHSRKHNVFMYGNNTSSEEDTSGVVAARAFISERLFPWLMSSKCPDKFSFRSCKFAIRRCKESTGSRWQQTEAVLQLTKAITQQILETRGLIGPGSALPDFLTVDKNVIETEAEAVQENAEKWTGAMLTLLQQPPQPDLSAANPDDKGQGRQERAKRAGTASSGLSKEEASKLLDRASLCTMDGCLNILAALNVRDALQESDSSDSDSESEPEMKPPEPKTRKKKRKSRKQRDKEHHDKKQASSDKGQEKEARGKTYSALPALLCAEAPPSNSHGHAFSGTNLSDTSLLTSAQLAKKQAGSNSVLDRLNKDRRSSQFQSKYEGRHNGGVPCFTEERSMERAAKRLAEMKKKYEDDKQRELTLYCVDEHGMYQYPPHMYPNVLTQDDFNHRLHVALSEGTANLSRTLMGMNVKTGYTHAGQVRSKDKVKVSFHAASSDTAQMQRHL